jgi:hypothetical protein
MVTVAVDLSVKFRAFLITFAQFHEAHTFTVPVPVPLPSGVIGQKVLINRNGVKLVVTVSAPTS